MYAQRRFVCLVLWLALIAQPAFAQDGDAVAGTTVGGRAKKTLKLPGTVEDVVVGGSGKFLVAYLKSVKKLAVIDVKEAKVAKYLSLPSDEILFTAGAEKLFVIVKDQSIIQRYSLATFEREVAAPLPSGLTAGTLTMGHSALGPLLVGSAADYHSGTYVLLNAKTLQPIENKSGPQGRGFECYSSCIVRASADGQVFTSTRTGLSPSGFYTLILNGSKPETYYEHTSLGVLLPNSDGSRIYAGGGVYNNKTKPVSIDKNGSGGFMLPSVTGDYYLRFSAHDHFRRNDVKPAGVSIHLAGDSRPIVTIPDLIPAPQNSGDQRSRIYSDKRVFYFPEFDTLALLGDADDSFELVNIKLDDELENSGIDYLFVNSRPPLTAESGKPYTYQVEVKSKKQGVKISLASGPEGMQVDAKGKVAWAVPAGERGEVDVILSVSDSSGQEVFQTFRLNVGDASPGTPIKTPPAVAKSTASSATTPKTTTPPPTSSSAGAATGPKLPQLTPAKFEGEKILLKLPAAADKMEIGGGGRYVVVLLKSLRKLAVIDLCEAKIAGYIAADDDNVHFAAGAEKLIVVLGEKNIITRWDLATLAREVTVPSEDPIRAVIMGNASAGPVLVVTGHEGNDSFRGGGLKFLDLAKLRPIPVSADNQQNFHFDSNPLFARASGDGRTFTIPGSFGAGVYIYDGQTVKAQAGSGQRDSYGPLLPGPDGQVLYSGGARFSQQMRVLSKPSNTNPGTFVPSIHGRFYMAVQHDQNRVSRGEAATQKIAMHIEGDSRPLVTLEDFQLMQGNDSYGYQTIPLDKRLAFVPDAQVIATITPTFDALELRKFDLDAALEASGIDYLFVTSRPPSRVKPDETVSYQIEVKAKKGGVKHRLESGPDGMSLSEQGLLTWKAPASAGAGDAVHSVIVAVSDAAEQEVFHTFQIAVEGRANTVATVPATPPGRTRVTPRETPGVPPVNEGVGPRPPSPAQTPQPYAKLVGQERTWTDAESGRTVDATFLGVEDGKVKARGKEGKELLIPLARISREDLIWLLEGK